PGAAPSVRSADGAERCTACVVCERSPAGSGPRGRRVIPLTPVLRPFSRGHQRPYSCHEHIRRVRTPRLIRPRSGLCDVLPTQMRRRDPRMDSRHDVTVGHELQAAAETGQIPVVPATADAGDQVPTWRSTLAVTISLVVAFAAVALVSL